MNQNHRARRLALQGLCCLDAHSYENPEMIETLLTDSKESAEIIDAARRMLTETCSSREEIDEILTRHAKNWELSSR